MIMARSNTTSVPEAKSAMNRFKYEAEWFRRRIYGQKNDRGSGTPDG